MSFYHKKQLTGFSINLKKSPYMSIMIHSSPFHFIDATRITKFMLIALYQGKLS